MSLRVMWRSKVAALAVTGFPENSFWWQIPHLACCAGRSGWNSVDGAAMRADDVNS